MNAIAFSVNPRLVNVNDAINHLKYSKNEIYWEVGFKVNKNQFQFPLIAYLHICGGQIEYIAEISEITDYLKAHYEEPKIADKVKPEQWRSDWINNTNGIRNYPWKTEFIISSIKPFKYDTRDLLKINGENVYGGPRSYVRVFEVKV